MRPYKRPASAWTFLTGLEGNPAYEAKLDRLPSSRLREVRVETKRAGQRTKHSTIRVEKRS